MREQLLKLEEVSRILEPDSASRGQLDAAVLAYADTFLNNLHDGKGYEQQDTSAALNALPVREQGYPLETLLNTLAIAVDRPGINPASGGHIGYIPGGGLYASALGDYLADITNRYAGIYFANPGAVRMENMLIRWMADMVGYPQGALGNLTSGGSIANLIAITTARDALQVRAADIPGCVIYMTAHTHHCVDKAIRIAGLGECIVRRIPLDERYAMDAQQLRDTVIRDRQNGLRPIIAIASIGSTDTGAVDPVSDIVQIAEEAEMWCQIDGAYGGFFQLVPELQHHFAGVGRSQSYILDPHKGMFLPYGTGTVLVRDGALLHASHWYQANYMQDAQHSGEFSPADLSPELTKHFRGLRMWLPLQLFGVDVFRTALTEKYLLAQYFHERIRAEGFETGPVPQLSVVIYRYSEGIDDPNAFNKQLISEMHRDGRIFISSTMIDGQFWLRLAVLSFRTHLHHIDLLVEMLVTGRNRLLQGRQ